MKNWLAAIIWLVAIGTPVALAFSVTRNPWPLVAAVGIVGTIWLLPMLKQWWDERV